MLGEPNVAMAGAKLTYQRHKSIEEWKNVAESVAQVGLFKRT